MEPSANTVKLILAYGLAYLVGTIPFGLLVARLVKNIDIREYGSKNIGATNVFRVVGKKWGVLVFVLDAFKGYLAIAFAAFISSNLDPPHVLFYGVAAILGHSFPVWLGFRGGKGVATSLGVFLTVAPLPSLVTFAIWIIVFALSRILSLASLFAAIFFPLAVVFLGRDHPLYPWLLPVSILLAGFIFFTHRQNIRRLLKGEENKLI